MRADDKAELNGVELSERLHYLKGRNEALAEMTSLLSSDQDALLLMLAEIAKADSGLASLAVLLERLADQREQLASRIADLRDEAAVESRLLSRQVMELLARQGRDR